jgi:hypothetical protein
LRRYAKKGNVAPVQQAKSLQKMLKRENTIGYQFTDIGRTIQKCTEILVNDIIIAEHEVPVFFAPWHGLDPIIAYFRNPKGFVTTQKREKTGIIGYFAYEVANSGLIDS